VARRLGRRHGGSGQPPSREGAAALLLRLLLMLPRLLLGRLRVDLGLDRR
jgi:hypothetical protein